MLNSLIIRNFRIFKEFKIDRLSHINLFVGKNNSGKSCLLEALQIYASKGYPRKLYKIVSSRNENWESLPGEEHKNSIGKPSAHLGYLFNGYSLPDIDEKAIEIGPAENESRLLKICHRAFHMTEDEEGRRIRTPVKQESLDDIIDIQTGLEITQGGERSYYLPLGYKNYMFHSISIKKEFNFNFQIVPAQKIDEADISVLWDNINLTDLEKEIVSALQIIDSKILGIALIGDKKRIPIIRYDGITERIPLQTLGEGVTRLFHIILALVNAKDGLLLIDEFENGLHWSIHPKLWEIILRLSRELNIQVIATTHSRDCIEGFYEVWKDKEEDDAFFYRLEADSVKGAKVINYTFEMLSDAVETDIEVR